MSEPSKEEILKSLVSENKVWVSIERSVNLGDYYSYVKFQAGSSQTIPEGKDPVETRDEIANQLIEDVNLYLDWYKKTLKFYYFYKHLKI